MKTKKKRNLVLEVLIGLVIATILLTTQCLQVPVWAGSVEGNVQPLQELDGKNAQGAGAKIEGKGILAGDGNGVALNRPVALNTQQTSTMAPTPPIQRQARGVMTDSIVLLIFVVIVSMLLAITLVVEVRRRNREIAREKRMGERLSGNYHWLLETSSHILIDADMETGVVVFNDLFKRQLGREPFLKNLSQGLKGNDVLHPEDCEVVVDAFRRAKSSAGTKPCEVRLLGKDGEYVWYSLELTPVFDEANTLLSILGRMGNINDQKMAIQRLEAKASTDALTQLCNKEATQALIEAFLQGEQTEHGVSVMMAIDVDNFKQVNDTKGHACGDTLLAELARVMKGLFRESDIIGRFGGDEFMVFLKCVPDAEFAMRKAVRMIQTFGKSYKQYISGSNFSVSVGISVLGKDGTDFATLYRKADLALYLAKARGKACCVFYDKAEADEFERFQEKHSQLGRTGESVHDGLFVQLFETVYNTPSIPQKIHLILEWAGVVFGMDRAFVMGRRQGAYEQLHCWCKADVEPHTQQEIDAMGQALYEFFASHPDRELLCCNDVDSDEEAARMYLHSPRVKGALHITLVPGNGEKGTMGFERLDKGAPWTVEEMRMMLLVARLSAMVSDGGLLQ